MIDLIKYRGYYGAINYCNEDNIFFAEVVGIGNSSISCHGDTLDQVKDEFIISIDYYLEVCEAEGWEPCITDPKVAHDMDVLLSMKGEDVFRNFKTDENIKHLVYAH